MHKWKLTRNADFLQLAHKQLNPGMWETVFHSRVNPDAEETVSSSSDEELNAFLEQVGKPKRKRAPVEPTCTTTARSSPSLICNETLADADTDTEATDAELLLAENE